jgi:GT2 family glycosyltransferase
LTSLDILVPYWGDPRLMRETVESVLAQDTDRWVLTVLDDAYADPAIGEWMKTLDHPRVRYLRNDKNLGIVGNYRKLLSMATQDLVMLLGCDDVLLPNYVSTVLKAHERFPDVAIIHPGTKTIDEKGQDISTLVDWVKTRMVMPRGTEPKLLKGESLATTLLVGDWMYWPALSFRADKLRQVDFNADLKITHDLAYVLDLVFAGESLLLDPTVCFAYRRHTGSVSTGSLFDGRRFREERQYFSIARAQADKADWRKAERAARWHLTSRANAGWILCLAIVQRRWASVPGLLGHIFNRIER